MDRGRPRFRQDFSCPVLLRCHAHAVSSFSLTGLSPSLVALSSSLPLTRCFLTALGVVHPRQHNPSTPHMQRYTPYTHPVWAPPLSLAATQGIPVGFFSSGYLDGSVHRVFLRTAMCSPYGTEHSSSVGYPIRLSADRRMFAPPRSFSQLTTAFIV